MDLVMFSRASVMKVFSQLSSSESLTPMTVSRMWNSRSLCQLETCGRQSVQRLRATLGVAVKACGGWGGGPGERSQVDAFGHLASNQ